MSSDDELMRIARKLDRITNRKDTSSAAQAVDMLKSLQRMKITLDQIQKTRIGKIVNNLRKSINDDEVSSLSKSLIKSWKKLLNEKDGLANVNKISNKDGDAANGSVEAANSKNSQNYMNSSSINGCNRSTTSNTSSQPKRPIQFSKQTSFPSDTTNSVRLKCRELLANALKLDSDMEDSETFDAIVLAGQIEDCIYKEFKDTNAKYKTRIRSRISNLNDKKNPDLKLNVLRGDIKAEQIAVMTAEEMASDDMRQLRQKFTKEAINDAQMSLTGGTKTDLIKCPACKKNNCTYNQVQTRSADEPMTTFCYCNECGKRWKFC